jgi:hypothetical protein
MVAITIWPGDDGKVSLKATPLMSTGLEFVRVIVRVETPPVLITFGVKSFAAVGAFCTGGSETVFESSVTAPF